MTRWLYVALAAQVLFFAGWGARLLTSHRDVAIVWLATEPVDPRDLLSGNYVALRYGIARTYCDRPDEGRDSAVPVWVQLVANGDAVATAEPDAVLASAIGCRTTPPEPGDDDTTWMLGRLDPRTRLITFGIERMFVGEDNPLRRAPSGSVVAKVAINDGFEPRLLALVSTRAEGER